MTCLCFIPFFKATMTDEWQIAALKNYEHTQIQKSEQCFPTISFKRSCTLNSEWAFCRAHMHECSAAVVQASIMPSIPRAAKDAQDTLRYFSLKPTEWRLSMLRLSPVGKQRGGKKRIIISAAPELLHCKTWLLHGHLVETRNRSTVE